MIIDMLIIVAIVATIFLTGFPFEMDAIVNKHFPLYHIPDKPFLCATCMSFWSNIAYLLITAQFSLMSLLIALLLAYAAPSIQNVLALIKACIDKIIDAGMHIID